MKGTDLILEPHDFLMEPEKIYGIELVFDGCVNHNDELVNAVINWAKNPYTLGFICDPIEIEYIEDDFTDYAVASIKWANEVNAVAYEVINLVMGYLNREFQGSNCNEIRVYTKMGVNVCTH